MADNRHRGRSPPRAPRGLREGASEYRSSSDFYRRSSRPSRSPDRERNSSSQRYRDTQYGFPGENNYRPRYSPEPPMRSDNMQDSKVPSTRTTSTNNKAHSDRIPLIDVKDDEPSCLTVSGSKTTEVATTIEQSGEEAAKALSPLLQELVTIVIECSTLKLHQNSAQKEFDRRSAEFNSAVGMHEKYPAIAETQTRSKARAEVDLKAISEKVGVRESALSDFAKQCVAHVIPQILAKTTGHGQPESQYKESQLRVEELGMKCEDYRQRLDDSQKQSKAQELRLENLQKSLDEQRGLFEDKFTGINKHFEELEKRSKIQEQLMGDHEEKYKKLEDKYIQLSDECGHTKGVLARDCLPQLASTMLRVTETERSTEALSKGLHDVRTLATRLESEVSTTLRPRLEKLSGLSNHVATIPSLRFDVDNIKQESDKSRQDLVKHMKNIVSLEGYYAKVNSLNHTLNGTGSPSSKGLAAQVNELVSMKASEASKSQKLKLEDGHAILALQGRLDKVVAQISDVDELRGTVSELQRNTAKFDDRLCAAESQKPSAPPTPPMDSAALLRHSQLNNQTIAAIDESISHIIARCSALEGWQEEQDRKMNSEKKDSPPIGVVQDPPMDYETLKREILEVADDKQSAADEVTSNVFTQLWTAVGDNKDGVKAIERTIADMKTAYDPLIALSEQVQNLTATFDLIRARQQRDETANEVFDSIQTRPELLRVVETKLELVTKDLFQASFQSVQDKLETCSEGLIAVDRRVNNINTKTMALFIIEQMESLYPNVRNVQEFINNMTAKFDRVNASLKSSSINTLQAKVHALEARNLKSNPNETLMQSIRAEVDDLARSIGKIQGTANSAKQISDIANDGFATVKNDSTMFQEDIAGEMGNFRIDLEEIKTIVQNVKAKFDLSERDKSSTAIPSRSVSASSAHPVPGRFGLPQRQPFAPGGQGHKKRKLDGSYTSSVEGGQSSGLPKRSPQKKRNRFRLEEVEEDNSEDSNFEPNLPSISISDDEDEL